MGEHFRFSEFIHIQKLGDVIHARPLLHFVIQNAALQLSCRIRVQVFRQ